MNALRKIAVLAGLGLVGFMTRRKAVKKTA